jgi:[protein-PII] uridylyltransferase
VADAIWYPLWDEGIDLDHAVRDTRQMRQAAADDHRAALGMLDLRHVAGNGLLSSHLRSQTLADWRRSARGRLAELRAAGELRAERAGDLAHAAVPDLKESRGGLRDGVVLRCLVATWLVDVPHAEAEVSRAALLDVRDALHEVAGRATDRLAPELVPDMARLLGHVGAAAGAAGSPARAAHRAPVAGDVASTGSAGRSGTGACAASARPSSAAQEPRTRRVQPCG